MLTVERAKDIALVTSVLLAVYYGNRDTLDPAIQGASDFVKENTLALTHAFYLIIIFGIWAFRRASFVIKPSHVDDARVNRRHETSARVMNRSAAKADENKRIPSPGPASLSRAHIRVISERRDNNPNLVNGRAPAVSPHLSDLSGRDKEATPSPLTSNEAIEESYTYDADIPGTVGGDHFDYLDDISSLSSAMGLSPMHRRHPPGGPIQTIQQQEANCHPDDAPSAPTSHPLDASDNAVNASAVTGDSTAVQRKRHKKVKYDFELVKTAEKGVMPYNSFVGIDYIFQSCVGCAVIQLPFSPSAEEDTSSSEPQSPDGSGAVDPAMVPPTIACPVMSPVRTPSRRPPGPDDTESRSPWEMESNDIVDDFGESCGDDEYGEDGEDDGQEFVDEEFEEAYYQRKLSHFQAELNDRRHQGENISGGADNSHENNFAEED
jgi:hypothetical protein